MTKNEMVRAYRVALSDKDLSTEDISIFEGYGLPSFEKVYTTINAVACLIRWQAVMMNGNVDSEELDAIATIGRKKFIIIG